MSKGSFELTGRNLVNLKRIIFSVFNVHGSVHRKNILIYIQ
jgi:hypothetical protein